MEPEPLGPGNEMTRAPSLERGVCEGHLCMLELKDGQEWEGRGAGAGQGRQPIGPFG